MSDLDWRNIGLKLSEALLLYKGTITLDEIRALPFFDDPRDAELTANYLLSKFKTRITNKRTQDENEDVSDEVIELVY